MIPVAKAAGIVSVGGAGLLGIYYFSNMGVVMPGLHFLSEDSDYTTKTGSESGNDYKDKYGQTYGKYLVGVTTKTGTPIHKNDNWWEWSFEYRYKPKKNDTKGKFANLSKATGETESLQAICKAAYSNKKDGDGAKIKETLSTTSVTDEFKESDIWLFCSPAEEKIKSITDENKAEQEYTANTIYVNNDKAKKDLVSTKSSSKGNTWFWNFKEQQLTPDDKTTLFKNGETSLKDWCEKAYKTNKTSDEEPITKQNVFKWCSLSGTPPTS